MASSWRARDRPECDWLSCRPPRTAGPSVLRTGHKSRRPPGRPDPSFGPGGSLRRRVDARPAGALDRRSCGPTVRLLVVSEALAVEPRLAALGDLQHEPLDVRGVGEHPAERQPVVGAQEAPSQRHAFVWRSTCDPPIGCLAVEGRDEVELGLGGRDSSHYRQLCRKREIAAAGVRVAQHGYAHGNAARGERRDQQQQRNQSSDVIFPTRSSQRALQPRCPTLLRQGVAFDHSSLPWQHERPRDRFERTRPIGCFLIPRAWRTGEA